MADKKPLDATFFAFQKRDKMVLLPATIAMFVILMAITALFVFLNFGAIRDYFQWISSFSAAAATGATPGLYPPSSVMTLIPSYFVLMVITYICIAAWEAACLKWMIRGDSSGLFGLSLGGDTWRVYLTYWLWLILFLVLYFGSVIAGFAAGMGLFGAAQNNTSGPVGVLITLAFIGAIIAIIGAVIFIAVRFAPAAAASVAQKRFAFFSAWTITQGRFWSLFGAFAILYLIFFVGYIIVSLVVSVVMGVAMATSMAGAAGGAPADPAQMFALMASPNFLVPLLLFYVVLGAAMFSFLIALLGVNARVVLAAGEEGKIQIPGVGPAEHFS